MEIQIVNIDKIQKSTTKGNGYIQLDVAYKNLTYGGKLESRKIMPFGTQEPIHKIFSAATGGQVYDVEQGKNAGGYNEFTSATLNAGGATTAPAAATRPLGATPLPARTNTYETPEERAKKQVYIVRQSSLSTAAAILSVGSKAAPSVDAVIDAAKKLEGYVFGIDDEPTKANADSLDPSGFGDMDDDLPF